MNRKERAKHFLGWRARKSSGINRKDWSRNLQHQSMGYMRPGVPSMAVDRKLLCSGTYSALHDFPYAWGDE